MNMNIPAVVTPQFIHQLGNAQVSNKIRIFLPEEKLVAEDIKERTINSLNVSSRWLKNKMRKDIINYYYSVENGTCLCDKSRIFQSSINLLSKFLQRYNFVHNKHSNQKVNKFGQSRLRCQRFNSYFHNMISTTKFYYLYIF